MKKIVFVNPPLTEEERGGGLSAAIAHSIPYGLISLAAVVRKLGYEPAIVDATNHGYDIEETVSKILSLKPDYVGIYLVTLSVDKAAKVAEKLKIKDGRLKVLVGGPHISSIPEETMTQFSSFDIGVIGEGEEAIVEVLTAIENGTSLGDVKGVAYREGTKLVRTDRRPFIKNLDSIPMPAWDLLTDLAKFYRPSAPSYVRLPSTTIVTSRGCPGNCVFCNSKAIFGGLRSFSAEYVVAMLHHLIDEYGIKDISIYDDNFIFFKDRIEKICKTIIDEKLDLTWSCYSRVDQGSEDLFRLMKNAGCWQISYGIESGSQRILDLIRKNVTLEQIENTVALTKKSGLRTRGFFIIGHMGETKDSIKETIKFMNKMPLDDFHFTYFTPLPGTDAYGMADRYGKLDKTYSKTNMQYPVFVPAGLTSKEMERYSKTAYKLFYFRPKIIFSYLWLLIRYPNNAGRLLNGLKALLSRIFLRNTFSSKKGVQ